MIFDTDILTDKVIGFHYNLMCFLPKDGFKGGKYGENYSLEQLRNFNFTNYEELSLILQMFNKMTSDIKVDLSEYTFTLSEGNYTATYQDNEIISINKKTLDELNALINNGNSSIVKSQYCLNEMLGKANNLKNRYNCHEMSNSDVLLFSDSNNEWKLNEIKV